LGCDRAHPNRQYQNLGERNTADLQSQFLLVGFEDEHGAICLITVRPTVHNGKNMLKTISIIEATMDDYPMIQNMARFYVYDISRSCGSISSDWALPKDGLYECFDFKNYFEEPSRKAYVVKVYDEIAGFVLLDQVTQDPPNTWNLGEFFIIAKFQAEGIGSRVAHEIWRMHPGTWEVSVIPENKPAFAFWEKTISAFTHGSFHRSIKEVTYDKQQPKRIVFAFSTPYDS
jgi:predicted acetyltransferase